MVRMYRNTLGLVLIGALLSPHGFAAGSEEAPLSSDEQAVVQWLSSRQEAMIDLLEKITNINSGSLNKSGVDAVAQIFSRELTTLGFSIETLPGRLIEVPHCPGSDLGLDLADHVLARRSGSGNRVLLMGHLDTVFPPESEFQTFRLEGDRMYGPGVYDMKGGLVVLLYALKALEQQGLLDQRALSVLLNSDEEVGSLSSRPYLEQEAAQHDYGLVFEGSVDNNMIRQRKGLGQAKIVVTGRAAHAGSSHQDGRSAIRELAYKIIAMENMTDYETGLTVNVGLINGGEARNMVAPCAEAYVDLRYPQPSQGLAAENQFREIASTVYAYPAGSEEISSDILVNLHRPPKIPTPESDRLLQRTVDIGRLLGEQIGVSDSGGGTDGSLTQAVGLPTLDSLGLTGTGAHTEREEARVDSLVQATQRAAILIHRLLTQ